MIDTMLRTLILEDRASDADLIEFELQMAELAYSAKRVVTEKEFIGALRDFSPDLILSDYDLPQYNGALALAEAKALCPDVPFILVTGAVGEDRAIEILTSGAQDYVMKDRLHRLVPAVRRVLAEADERKARKKAEEELREAHKNLEILVEKRTEELQREIAERKKVQERYRLAVKASNDAIWDMDLINDTVQVNETYTAAFGGSPKTEKARQRWIEHIHPEDRERTAHSLQAAINSKNDLWLCNFRFLRTDGAWANICNRAYIAREESGKAYRIVGAMRDVTPRSSPEDSAFRNELLVNAESNLST